MKREWKLCFQKIKTSKDLRLTVQKFFRERLKGLPSGFRIEVETLKTNPPKVLIKIPAHSEANPIRIAEVDHLVAELETYGVETVLCYLDDLEERNAWPFSL